MSGRLTVWGANQLLTSYFTISTTPPPNFYLALIKEIAPTPYMVGSELDEPDNAEYTRVMIENDAVHWANDSQPQEIYNSLQVDFMTAITDWGTIRYWALCNAEVDGFNFLVGNLEDPVLIMTGDQLSFAEGDLSVALGPFFLTEET